MDIKDEARRDMEFVSGNPWTDADKAQRLKSGRPIVTFDEFGQYINQVINNLRMNKRGIKVTAKGGGANDASARFRQGKIRDWEYRSNAQQAYTTMAADAIQRSYGYLKVTARRVGDGWNQEPVIQPIVNPDLIEPDPDFLRSDGTDWKYLFEYRPFGTVSEFNRRFPDATKTGFDATDMAVPGGWYDGKKILLASYWAQDTTSTRKKLRLKPDTDQGDEFDAWEDEAGEVKPDRILNRRDVEQFTVTQYLTNGFEILDRKVWPGQSIPYVGCYGKILYVNGKRVILSMVRLARDPAMLLNFTRAKQMETVGALLSFPYFYVRGSLTQGSIDLMTKSVHEPVVAIPVEPSLSGETQYPQKQIGEPAVQALEMLADAMRRAIQAGMGQGFLPTDAQKPNNKSGTALDTINSTAQRGSFHFDDHYNEGVTRTGVILDEVMAAYVDTEQETSIRNEQDESLNVRVNAPVPQPPPAAPGMPPQPAPPPAWAEMNKKAGLPPSVMIDKAHLHDITISVGPAEDSQRTMVNDLVQSLVNNAGFMQEIGPQKGAKVLAMSLKTLNAGPQVDAIAAIIDPPEDGQPNPQQLQQKMQQMGQELGAAKDAVGKLSQEIATKKADLESKERIAKMDNDTKLEIARKDREVKLGVAELGAKVDRLELFMEESQLVGARAADAAEADKQRAHDLGMAHVGAATAAVGSAQDHGEALNAGAQGHAQALESQEQAAALAPPPEAAGV